MSQSTDAILFFGFCWKEEGVPLDEDAYSDNDQDQDNDNEELDICDLDRAYAKRKGLDKNKLPFEFFTHCHREAPMLALAVKGTVTRAWRGYPKEINPEKMDHLTKQLVYATYGETEASLVEVCKTLGLKPTKLSWWLVSDWS